MSLMLDIEEPKLTRTTPAAIELPKTRHMLRLLFLLVLCFAVVGVAAQLQNPPAGRIGSAARMRGQTRGRDGATSASQWATRARLMERNAFESSSTHGVRIIRDVEYGTGGGHPLTCDLLMPNDQSTSTLSPAILFVHGGGWRTGSKENRQPLLSELARHGYVVVTINYRLTGEAPFPAQIEDTKCAVRWMRAHSKEYGIDPNRIGAWGTSAGGHLVALLGTSAGAQDLEGNGGWADQSSRVQAVVDSFGPTDLVTSVDRLTSAPRDSRATIAESAFLPGPPEARRELAKKASPLTYVSKNAPPFLMIHGERDQLVPLWHSEVLRAALKKVGVSADLIVLPEMGHGARSPESDSKIIEFFDEHLKK